MIDKEQTLENKRSLLYTYWHELPFYKDVSSTIYNKLIESDIKNFIIKYVRDGIEDDFGKTNGLRRRHAFTTKELQEAFERITDNRGYSSSNFHFHINALVEDGFIMEIAKILEGRHYRTYYGRTAISISPTMDNMLTTTMEQNIFGPMKVMAKEFNPDLEDIKITQLFEENLRLLKDFYFRINRWLKERYPQIYTSKLDMLAFLSYAAHFSVVHEQLNENLTNISKMIKFDDIVDYEGFKQSKEEK